MTRLIPTILGALALGACAANMGAPREIDAPTVALHAEPAASPGDVASAIDAANARAVFLTSTRDDAWFASIAATTDMHLTGPTSAGAVRIAFLGSSEPVGDTLHTLEYEGGSVPILDALYEVASGRFLDLLTLRIEPDEQVRPIMTALLQYVATDVGNEAALVMAITVPDEAAGDSVARMLSPAYSDARRCGDAVAAGPDGEEIRLFYGPAARMFCVDAVARNTAMGDWLRAELVMGRR